MRTVAVRLPHNDVDGLECSGPIPVRVIYERPTSYQAGGYTVEDVPDTCPSCYTLLYDAERDELAEKAIDLAVEIDQDARKERVG